MRPFCIGLILVILFGSLSGCRHSGKTVESREEDSGSSDVTSAYYTSAFPTKNISREIKTIFNSVKRITITATYQTFFFEDSLVALDQIQNDRADSLASYSVTRDESVAGTAISIADNRSSTVMLTCEHVVNFPDTLVEYVDQDNVPAQTFVKSLAVKLNQRNLVYDLPYVSGFDIVDVDQNSDLALIRFSKTKNPEVDAPPLSIKIGDSKELEWGSFIYVVGYPKGNPIITRGVVSNPNKTADGDFTSDALFNPGISGGIILASRDNFSSFEWVGMANTTSADNEWILVPDPSKPTPRELLQPYSGTIFLKKKFRIAYGVTQAIPTTDIIDFLKGHKNLFDSMNIEVSSL